MVPKACFTALAGMLLFAGTPLPTQADDPAFIEEVLIVGERAQANRIAGSAHHIGLEELRRLGHADIQRVIRQVPGVSVQVEDGYGLRPNISIRGVATERSGRITLLEDNVLIAPAPYSAPSAYYFPTLGRMAAIEVLTGPAAISQGPYTIGGALNMLSTPIPDEAAGYAMLEGAEDATWRLHGHYGARNAAGFGFLVETHQWRSDGFQGVDRGGDSGLDLEDYTFKLSYAPEGSDHALALKVQIAEQDSEQSYLGLTDADFARDPFRRYGLSSLDNIATEHEQLIVRYQWTPSDSVVASVIYYNNEYERNWFKTEGIDFDGSADAQSFSRTSWSNVVQAINLGQPIGGVGPGQLQAILHGTLDTAPGSIQIRSNARTYFSRGVQGSLSWTVATGALSHRINLGARYHEDEEDRLQRNSTYHQSGGRLHLDDQGLLGNAGNRLQEAEARSLYLVDEIQWGRW
ncbi:MAG: TonB-dependent receptor plug domain-containing protein, partial [Gammaproteobacteria bacterium]|nr:TonB-dependent receptor plug domain-containing protein [Gammaproteobacteria bacterium]